MTGLYGRHRAGYRVLPLLLVIGCFSSAEGHHGAAPFDTNETVTFEATVSEFDYRNPHGFLYVEATDANGETREVMIETVGSSLRPYGLTPESLAPGDRVAVVMNPSHSTPDEWGLGVEVIKEDGTVVPLSVRFAREREQRSTGSATSMAGLWVPRREDFFRFTFGRRDWPLTEKGEAARASFNVNDSPQGQCIPIPPPTLMLYASINVVEILDDRVLIHSDWLDGERVIYTDGRTPDDDETPTMNGFSSGAWNGNTLSIETSHFLPNNSGNASGIPSSANKRLTEEFTLIDDGAGLRYTYLLEDPEYLAEPRTGEGRWDFRPDLEPDPAPCDLDSASRYLNE